MKRWIGFSNDWMRVLVFGLVFSCFLLISEWLVRSTYHIKPLASPTSVFVIGFLVVVLFTKAKSRFTVGFIALYIIAFFSIEVAHLAYFGYWIPAINLWLLVEKIDDVVIVGTSVISKMLIPALLTSGLIVIFFFLYKERKRTAKKSKWVDVVVLLAFFFLPVKSFLSPARSAILGRIVQEEFSILKSAYYTTNYFLARTLPQEILGWSNIKHYIAPAPQKINGGLADNIVIVMGESLSSNYMSVFGFEKETTPWLNKQSQQSSVLLRPSYSSALFTDVSIPYFFNMIKQPNGVKQIASGDTNLFRLAKENGYETHFISTQPAFGLGFSSVMGRAWIDHYIDSFSVTNDMYKGIDDAHLLVWLEKIDLSKKNFIVLNQNGSHEPYSTYVPEQHKIFKPMTSYNDYLSSVYYTDQIVEKIHDMVQQRVKNRWLLLFTADHGQHVTETSMGKGFLGRDANYLVPTYLDSNTEDVINMYQQAFAGCPRIFHYQLSTLLGTVLGYNTPLSDCKQGTVTVGRLTGSDGYMQVNYQDNAFVNKEQTH